MLAALIDGMNDSGLLERRRCRRRHLLARHEEGRARHRPTRRASARTAPTWRPSSPSPRCAGATSACLLTMPRQGLGNSAIAAVANDEQKERFERQVGRDGDHRARGGLRLGLDPHHRDARRRRVRPQRREDLRHLRRPRRADRRLGLARPEARPLRDQVVRRPPRQPRPEAGPARAQARDQGLGHGQLHPHRLPRAEGGPARLARDRHEEVVLRRDEDVRQHAPAGRRHGRRPRQGLPRRDAPDPRRGRRRDRLRQARQRAVRRRRPSSSSSRPTTRPRAC